MSFRLNPIKKDGNSIDTQQLSFFSPIRTLSDRYIRDLEKGWAGSFRSIIMPNIDEEPYRVLYSDIPGRSNFPVNILLGALILKEMKQLPTDDDVRERVCFDLEYRYALCAEEMDGAPFSDNVMTNFRRKCIEHYLETGEDLIHKTFDSLTEKLAEFMEIDDSLIAIDSTMVASKIKNMNRLELLYTNNELMIEAICGVKIHKRDAKTKTVKPGIDIIDGQISFIEGVSGDKEAEAFRERREAELESARRALPASLVHYLSKDNKNLTLYHNKEDSYASRVENVIGDAKEIIRFCQSRPEKLSLEQYDVFSRIFFEQCKEDGEGNYALRKAGEGMDSDMIQSPHDIDATYRSKDGKCFKGYTAVFTQAKNADGETLIMDYDVDKNNVSDQEFGARLAGRLEEKSIDAGATIVGDSLFSGEGMEAAAGEKNYEIVNTNLTGAVPPDHYADNEFDEDGELVKCAGGAKPVSTKMNKDGSCTAKIEKSACENCPHRDKCKIREQKNSNSLRTSKKAKERAEKIRERGGEKFRELSHFRNGVETVPSALKEKLKIDTRHGRSLADKTLGIGISMIALNTIKALQFLDRRVDYALI